MNFFYIVKANAVARIKTRAFLIAAVFAVAFAVVCTPPADAGYDIFVAGAARGLYNSAWLGMMNIMLFTTVLWLPAFYLVRHSISDDRQLNVSALVASCPIGKTAYIFTKCASNFLTALSLHVLFMLTFMAMQFIRMEDTAFVLSQWLLPMCYIGIPSLCMLAALAVLFDSAPFLKGAIGNTLIFFMWIWELGAPFIRNIGMTSRGTVKNLFSFNIMSFEIHTALEKYVPGSPRFLMLTYSTRTEPIATFPFEGITWDTAFLAYRLVWIAAALACVFLAVLCFDRFVHTGIVKKDRNRKKETPQQVYVRSESGGLTAKAAVLTAAPVFGLLRNELKLAASQVFFLWRWAFAAGFALSWFLPINVQGGEMPIALLMALPLPFLSQSGTLEKTFSTQELLMSCPSFRVKRPLVLTVNLYFTLAVSAGVIVRLFIAGNTGVALSWLTGCFFLSALAFCLGYHTKTRRVFEAVFIAIFYIGPLNGAPYLDFLGLHGNYSAVYLIAGLVLTAAGFAAKK